jgi:magnesium-transporting ATPase (P-type)
MVKDKTGFPADLLLLTSNHEDGTCYIDTMNLDGETNLKRKKAHEATVGPSDEYHAQAAELMSASLRCEGPSGDLYHFSGVLKLKSGEQVPVDANQLLLRGARLRNTHWIIGLVLFTGADTREMQNAKEAAYKQSNVERKMNWLIVGIFVAQTILCIISAIIGGQWVREYAHDHKYLDCESYFDCNPDTTGTNCLCVLVSVKEFAWCC